MQRFRNTDYFVTENGRVISTKFGKTKELKQFINSGYYCVGLSINNKVFAFLVSRLVAEIYHPNPNNLPEVDHIDCNKLNNHVDNLEWVTYSENIKRAFKNGLIKHYGEDNSKSKLTEKDIIWIRKNYIPRHKEFGGRPLSVKFNVTFGLISNIIKRRCWKHI
jgi:hypothetical protein